MRAYGAAPVGGTTGHGYFDGGAKIIALRLRRCTFADYAMLLSHETPAWHIVCSKCWRMACYHILAAASILRGAPMSATLELFPQASAPDLKGTRVTRYPRELQHFLLLTRDEQEAAICRLAKSGMSEYSIATATRLSVEQVRRVLAADVQTRS